MIKVIKILTVMFLLTLILFFTETLSNVMYSLSKIASFGQSDCRKWSETSEIIVCAESPSFLHGQSGTMYGNVYITSQKMEDISQEVINHEIVHYNQQKQYGILFIPLYFIEGVVNPCINSFEEEASYNNGGYYNCFGKEKYYTR